MVLLSLHINSLKVLSLFDNTNECLGVHLAHLGVTCIRLMDTYSVASLPIFLSSLLGFHYKREDVKEQDG